MKEMTRLRFAVPLWAPRRAGWWVLVLASSVGAAMAAKALWPGVQDFPTAGVTAAVFTVPLVVAWWWILRMPQLWGRVSASGAGAALLWGACAAAGVYALPSNAALITVVGQRWGVSAAQEWGAALVAPLTEETGKAMAIGVVLLASSQRLRTPMDAALIGAFSGLGFTATEDLLYAFNIAYINLGENEVISTTFVYFLRAILFGAVSHVVFSAAVGAGLGYLLVGKGRLRVPCGLALVLLGPALHALWNSPLLAALWTRFVYIAAVPLVTWCVLRWVRRSEAEWFARTLATPGAMGGVPLAYLDAVRATWWQRRAYRASVVKAYGPAAIDAQRAIEAQLTDLADAVDVGDAEEAQALRAGLEDRLLPSA